MWLEPTLVFLHKCQEQTPPRPPHTRLGVPIIGTQNFLFVPNEWRMLLVRENRPEFDVGKEGVETLPFVKSCQSFRRVYERGRSDIYQHHYVHSGTQEARSRRLEITTTHLTAISCSQALQCVSSRTDRPRSPHPLQRANLSTQGCWSGQVLPDSSRQK